MEKEYPFDEKISSTVNEYRAIDGTTDEGAVKDILIDLLHFCEKKDIDLFERLECAKETFEQEIDDEE